MADRYRSFAELVHREGPDAFSVRLRSAGSATAIVAPHGGAIEPGTSEIALAIAAHDLSYYLFEGRKARANRQLHLTSDVFDEPRGLALIESVETVITIHGERSRLNRVCIGGLDAEVGELIGASLAAAGFAVDRREPRRMGGLSPYNLANRGRSGAGVQLELSSALREGFFAALTRAGRARPTPRLAAFAEAVRAATAKRAAP